MAKLFRLGAEVARPWRQASVTVGNFDGVHRGHQDLVGATVKHAKGSGHVAVVLTFDPHPAAVLTGERPLPVLTRLARRADLLGELGIDYLAVMDFSPDVAALSPWDFARDVLRERLGAVRVTVGEGFRFAVGRSGDVASLGQMGRDLGFDVEERPRVFHRGAPISSSRVREAMAEGDVVLAGELCGRPVRVEGLVVEGDGRGRTLGIPTANLATAGDDSIPGPGVYACHAWLPGSARRPAVVNTGVRPTFGGVLPRVEAHLPGFSGDLYGSVLALDFLRRIRVERRFESVEQLVARIRLDIAEAERLLEQPPLFG